MSDLFRPMLATDVDLSILRFPVLASPKLDGIRAVVRDGVVYSRSNKPIPNKYVQKLFGHLNTLDGELIVGLPTAKDCYTQTTSHVMSHDKANFPVTFYVFDCIRDLGANYTCRQHWAEEVMCELDPHNDHQSKLLEQTEIHSLEHLEAYEAACLEEGYEGVILRSPDAPYKCGRSTAKEQYLLKVKQFSDQEYRVIGFEEREHNGNEAIVNELGRTKRSSHKAGKTGCGDLGALVLDHGDGQEFRCGTGFSDELRQEIWDNRPKYLGKLAKVKSFLIGVKSLPRHPVFVAFRDEIDL